MKVTKRVRYSAATVIATAALIGGGAAVANAATASVPSASSGVSGSASGSSWAPHQHGRHTEASADETAKVTAAVKAKDATATVTKVEKDADGSFDARATSNGKTVRYEVSADYATVTQHAAGGRHSERTALSSDELAKVTAAVKAKDANASVKASWKNSNGSFGVVATSGSTTTRYRVSADYTAVTAHAVGQGGGHRLHDRARLGSSSGGAGGAGGTTQG